MFFSINYSVKNVVLYKAQEERKIMIFIDSQFIMFFIPYSHGIIKYLKHDFFLLNIYIYCTNYVQTSSNVMSTISRYGGDDSGFFSAKITYPLWQVSSFVLICGCIRSIFVLFQDNRKNHKQVCKESQAYGGPGVCDVLRRPWRITERNSSRGQAAHSRFSLWHRSGNLCTNQLDYQSI